MRLRLRQNFNIVVNGVVRGSLLEIIAKSDRQQSLEFACNREATLARVAIPLIDIIDPSLIKSLLAIITKCN